MWRISWNVNRWLWYISPRWLLVIIQKATGHTLVGQQAEDEAVTYWWWEKTENVKKRFEGFDR